jgi:hypothetical protein
VVVALLPPSEGGYYRALRLLQGQFTLDWNRSWTGPSFSQFVVDTPQLEIDNGDTESFSRAEDMVELLLYIFTTRQKGGFSWLAEGA